MENILTRIINECKGQSQAAIAKNAVEAKDTLLVQQGNPMIATYSLREKCLITIESVLESKCNRLIRLGLEALQFMLRDNQLHSVENNDETLEQSLPMQVVHTLCNLPSWKDDSELQCHCLTILLQLISSPSWSLEPRVLCDIVELCISTFAGTDNVSVRMAARATVIQTVRSYCSILDNESDMNDSTCAQEMYDNVEVLLSYCCEKLDTILSSSENSPPLLLMLDAISAILSALNERFIESEKLLNLVWKQLCPMLIAIFGNPSQIDASHIHAGTPTGALGRGLSSASGDHMIFGAPEVARAANGISVELLRLLGPLPQMRSVLEAVFHRLLIFPPVDKRTEALKTLRRATETPAICLWLFTINASSSNDLTNNLDQNLWKIAMDCLVECSFSSSIEVTVGATKCALSAVRTLQLLYSKDSTILSDSLVEQTNKKWPHLKNVTGANFSYEHFGTDDTEQKLKAKAEGSPVAGSPTHSSDKSINSAHKAETEAKRSGEQPEDSGPKSPIAASMDAVADKIGTVLADTSTETEEAMRVYYGKIRDAWEQRMQNRPGQATTKRRRSFIQRETETAEDFVSLLCSQFVKWSNLKSTIELDSSIQEFSIQCCEDLMLKQLQILQNKQSPVEVSIFNVDSIYLLTMACLRLIYRLHKSGYHTFGEKITPFSEGEFQNLVYSAGTIAYATSTFVSAVYYRILSGNIFNQIEIDFGQASMFLEFCKDFDGSDGEFLSDFVRLEKNVYRKSWSARNLAAQKLCRRVLMSSWQGLSKVFCQVLERGKQKGVLDAIVNVLSKSQAKQERCLLSEGVACALDALQMLALLCSDLGLEENCCWIFHKLVEASCPLEDLRRTIMDAQEPSTFSLPSKLLKNRIRWPLHLPHALSMEVVLDSALTIASRASDCWTAVVRCCQYVCELEHWLFSDSTAGKSIAKLRGDTKKLENFECDEDDFIIRLVTSPVRPSESVIDAVERATNDAKTQSDTYLLTFETEAKVLCILAAKADRIFEEAARCLNLEALKELAKAIIASSQSDLFYGGSVIHARLPPWSLLQRLSTLIVRLCKSKRPLLHLFHIWGVCAPHFVEAACAKNHVVANRAIAFLHDVVAAVIASHFDLSSFYFTESLLQPFATILCLDVSGDETQDQTVSAMAELVSMHKESIFFGWKALFAALRAVHYGTTADSSIEHVRLQHTATVDIFTSFLAPNDLNLFCLAAADCLNTLFHLVNSPAPVDDSICTDEIVREYDIGRTALTFLRQYFDVLSLLFADGDRNFAFVHLIRRFSSRDHSDQLIDRELVNVNLSVLPSLATMLAEESLFDSSMEAYFLEHRVEEETPVCPWAEMRVEQQLACEALTGMIEGLVGSVATCPRHLQPQVVEILRDVIVSLLVAPGLQFCAYCLNHLVLPMLQSWLRREALSSELSSTSACSSSADWRENSPTVRNFKQCLGLIVDAVVDVVKTSPSEPCCKLLLAQTLDLLTECVGQPSEVIGRLGCSSLRHLVTSLNDVMNGDILNLLCRCLWRIGGVTLFPLRLLISFFRPSSRSYFGDLGRVEVALRKDSNPNEAARLRALAQQVFLLDSQKYEENLEDHPDLLSQSSRSVVFVLHRSNDEEVIKLPFRNIIVSLLNHQLWLQLIGMLLLDGTSLKLCGLSSTLTRHVMTGVGGEKSKGKLPGCLSILSSEHAKSLLLCLDASMTTSFAFDCRPGLKFLIQKVFSSPVPANLYKLAVTSWTFKLLTLYEISLHGMDQGWTPKSIKECCGDVHKSAALLPVPDPTSLACLSPLFYLQWMYRSYMAMCCRCCELLEKQELGETVADRLSRRPLMLLASEFNDHSAQSVLENQETKTDCDDDVVSVSSDSSTDSGDIDGDNQLTIERDTARSEKVYSLASSDTVTAVLSDYKRAKKLKSLPSAAKADRRNPFDAFHQTETENRPQPAQESCPDQQDLKNNNDLVVKHEVDEAVVKDGDARRNAWSEMTASLLELTLRLPKDKFKAMLPSIYPALILLSARSTLPHVRAVIADLLFLLPEFYGLLD